MDRVTVALSLLLAGCATQRDYRGIIHCHTKYSHDSTGRYEEILAAAKSAGVDFVVITDHPPEDDPGRPLREGWRGLRDGVLFIQGAELRGNILAIGIREPIRSRDRQAMIDEIHAQGGLAFVCHPEEVTDWNLRGLDGMEVYNVHAALGRRMKDPAFLTEAVRLLTEDPDRLFLPLAELDPEVVGRWRSLRIAGIAGNDAHRNVKLFGVQLDPYDRAFRFVSTHVLAESLTETAILRALRERRCYVAFDILGDPRGATETEREFRGRKYPWIVRP